MRKKYPTTSRFDPDRVVEYSYLLSDGQHPFTQSSIAQLAEHSTVNRRVTGSSPVGGAKLPLSSTKRDYLRFVYISSEA